MRILMAMAWRNLWRHRRRSLITATAMAVAVALCMALIAFTDGMYNKMAQIMVDQQLGHALATQGESKAHEDAVVADLRAVEHLGDARVEAPVQGLDAASQPRHHRVAPPIGGPQRVDALHVVPGVAGEEGSDQREVVGGQGHLEGAGVLEEAGQVRHVSSGLGGRANESL